MIFTLICLTPFLHDSIHNHINTLLRIYYLDKIVYYYGVLWNVPEILYANESSRPILE